MPTRDQRDRVVRQLLDALQHVHPTQPAQPAQPARQARQGGAVLVALDGFDGAGKTHLAGELIAARTPAHRPMVSVTIDHFHQPRAARRAAGNDADGFYRGSYRYDAFRDLVVTPLRTGRAITPAIWDVTTDEPLHPDPVDVPSDAIVIVDGIFLQRPELADVWDATVWVDAPFEVTVPRGNARFPGTHDPDPDAITNQRYVGGQRLYLTEADPITHSTWIFHNHDLHNPTLTRQPT